ncbi:MAG: AbrB/MazE/SpoVT family DNA-binding domain-containing protein [Treponemataceae bacterium]|nr:MAG: AbrB/MazE/SpoVT family DNA-binding domain-containing protein [Treponemataceae bacterium]
MEVAKVTSKGQITIPRDIRVKMDLKKGDKIVIFEENGRYFLQNSNSVILETFQKNMAGAAKDAGFDNPDDVAEYIKQLRKNKRA